MLSAVELDTRMFDSGVDMLSLHCGTMCLMMHTTVTQYDWSLSVSCFLTLVKLEQSVLILTMCGRRRVWQWGWSKVVTLVTGQWSSGQCPEPVSPQPMTTVSTRSSHLQQWSVTTDHGRQSSNICEECVNCETLSDTVWTVSSSFMWSLNVVSDFYDSLISFINSYTTQ